MELKIEHIQHYPMGDNGLKMISSTSGRSAYCTTLKRRLKKIETLKPDLIELFIFLRRKPILHPLSDLTKPIKVEGYNDGKEFVPMEELFGEVWKRNDLFPCPPKLFDMRNFIKGKTSLGILEYRIVEGLFKWHFDVFGLIEAGFAIDINTLNK